MEWNSLLVYDTSSPSCLRWATDLRNVDGRLTRIRKGRVAGRLSKSKQRWDVGYGGKLYAVSRVIWEMFNGRIPEEVLIDHRDGDTLNNLIGNLRLTSPTGNARNSKLSNRNKVGVGGVYRVELYDGRGSQSIRFYYRAVWQDQAGKQKIKQFSIDRLGEQVAKGQAIKHRLAKISELNALGAGYTERHGT